jgi:lactate dehydrogenase-like 2-hydroxyacid dehydrogenase
VLITAHQGFFTEQALRAIAATTLGNITAFEAGKLAEISERIVVGNKTPSSPQPLR